MARTKPIFTAQLYDRRHLRNIASQLKAVQALYWDAIDTLCNRGERWLDVEPGRELHFEDFPMFNAEADKVVQNLARQLQLTIEQGNEEAWTLSNLKNDTMVKRMGFVSHVPPEKLEQWTMPHMEALEQFNARVVAGMNLSERVWNLAQPFKSEMELALEIGIGDGLSAADLSRQVRRHLNEPNRLFRRVRDRDGNLRLSKAAAAYHPGRGVYRSSYKNALRMTATENNMAYRTADHQRWKQLDFVTGIEISTSPTNHLEPDICDELKGIYPKDFKFVGWHPWCRCIATAKTADDKQFDNYIDRILAGEDVDGFHFEGEVTEMPECFTSWVSNNRERIARARTTPYFITDNYVDGDPSKGFRWQQKKQQARRRTAKTPDQIREITERWRRRRINTLREAYYTDEITYDEFKTIRELNNLDDLGTSEEARQKIERVVSSMKTRKKATEAFDELERQISTMPINKREMSETLLKQAREDLRKASFITQEHWDRWKDFINSVITEDAAGTIAAAGQPLRRAFRTADDVGEAFTEIEKASSDKWFVNVPSGKVQISITTEKGVNGLTYRDGRIELEKKRLNHTRTCLRKIGQGYEDLITKDEADAMVTLWHEITHNMHKGFESPGAKASLSRSFMELANEWVARHTLPEFYARLGIEPNKMPFKEFMKKRTSTGYDGMVTSFDHVIGRMGLDREAMMRTAKEKLFQAGGYANLEEGLAQALIDGGLAKADGTLATIDEAKELMRLVERTDRSDKSPITRWLKSKGFEKRKKKK